MQSTRPQPVWKPSLSPDRIPMNQYRWHVNRKFGQNLINTQELHRWSVTHPHDFWLDLHDYTEVIPKLPDGMKYAYDPNCPMSEIPKFFEGAEVNYAENVLVGKPADKLALVGIREKEALSGDQWTWGELSETVRKVQSALKRNGVQKGDRVGAIISTSVWSVVLFLATASIGAVWTSIAPDIGEEVISLSPYDLYLVLKMTTRDASLDCNKLIQRCYSSTVPRPLKARPVQTWTKSSMFMNDFRASRRLFLSLWRM